MKAPQPANESDRRDALRRYEILDTAPEQEFDDITSLAAHICATPIALICFLDDHRQWCKSKVGTAENEIPRDISFCGHGILQRDIFAVKDALADERFVNSPAVTGPGKIRFYAGSPLVTPDGHALGMLCVQDRTPRELTAEQKTALQALARQVMAQLELRRHLKDLRAAEKELRDSQALYHSLIEQLPAGVFLKDTAGRYVLVNSWFCRLRGRSAAEILGRTAGELAAAETDENAVRLLTNGDHHHEQIIRTGKTLEVEEPYPIGDKDVLHLHVIKSPVYGAEGKATGTQGILLDVTRRKKAEDELNHERNLLRALMEGSEELIYFQGPGLAIPALQRSHGARFKVTSIEGSFWANKTVIFSTTTTPP